MASAQPIIEMRKHPLGWAAFYSDTILFIDEREETDAYAKRYAEALVQRSKLLGRERR